MPSGTGYGQTAEYGYCNYKGENCDHIRKENTKIIGEEVLLLEQFIRPRLEINNGSNI